MPDNVDKDIASAVAEASSEAGVPDTISSADTDKVSDQQYLDNKADKAQADMAGVKEVAEEKPAKAAKPAEEEEEEEPFFTPTAEELELIDKNPELKKVYRSMQRGMTKKAQALANEKKQHQTEVEIANWVRVDPKGAARAIASITGMTVAEAKEAVADIKAEVAANPQDEKWVAALGPEGAKIMRDLIRGEAAEIAQQIVEPYRQQAEGLASAAMERGVAASLREFGASVVENGGDFGEEVQDEMNKVMDLIDPSDSTSIQDYLQTVHDVAASRLARGSHAKESLRRLRAARGETEPTRTGRPEPKSDRKITLDMSDRDAVALAVEMARNEHR